MKPPITDEQITGLYRAAWRHASRLWRDHPAMSREDLVQQAVVAAIAAMDGHDPSKGASRWTLAYGKLRYAVIDGIRDFLHRRKVPGPRVISNSETLKVLEDNHHAPISPEALRLDQYDTFKPYLKGLWPHERLALTLRFVDGMTYEEIGQAIGITESGAWLMMDALLRRMKARMTA